MLALLLTRRVTLHLAGEARRVVFTHRSLLAIEDRTGVNILCGGLDLARCSASHLRAVLSVLFALPVQEAGALITFRSIREIRAALVDGWAASMPDPDPDAQPAEELPTWDQAWARAHCLGLHADEWLDATPRMVRALAEERLEHTRHQELMQSRMIATTANYSMRAPKEILPDDEFMIHPWPKPPAKPCTAQDIMAAMAPFRTKEIA